MRKCQNRHPFYRISIYLKLNMLPLFQAYEAWPWGEHLALMRARFVRVNGELLFFLDKPP